MDSNWMEGYDDWDNGEGAGDKPHDPIIFDLDGDGIETTTIDNGTFFDYENDGFKEATAWVGDDDGILVEDKDLSGTIDNESELVTDLSTYDTNSDGIINSSDADFSKLKILTGTGVLESLEEAGIASIDTPQNQNIKGDKMIPAALAANTLAASSSSVTVTIGETDSSGNNQLSWGSYTTTSGTTRKYGDYELETNTAYSIETTTVAVSDEIEALPDISSYGTVHSLHQAKIINLDKYRIKKCELQKCA
jgi:hypothetical protein